MLHRCFLSEIMRLGQIIIEHVDICASTCDSIQSVGFCIALWWVSFIFLSERKNRWMMWEMEVESILKRSSGRVYTPAKSALNTDIRES